MRGHMNLKKKKALSCRLSKIHKICCLSPTYFVWCHNIANITKQMADLRINTRTKPKIRTTKLVNQ